MSLSLFRHFENSGRGFHQRPTLPAKLLNFVNNKASSSSFLGSDTNLLMK